MRNFSVPGQGPDRTVGVSRHEKRRLAFLGFAALLVATAVGLSLLRSRRGNEESSGLPLGDEAPTTVVSIPELDVALLEGRVRDATPQNRVVLENDALDLLRDHVRLFTDRHFEVLGTRTLDARGIASILEAPAGFRGAPFRARGWIEEVRARRRGPTGETEYLGKLVLEDGSAVYFVVSELADSFSVGSFVRVDGLFLKAFSDESGDQPGVWIEGPLLVGPEAIRSYKDGGRVTEIDPAILFQVQDDELVTRDGAPAEWSGIPFEPLWHLMAYARDLPPGEIEWDRVPELDDEALSRLRENGTAFRGQAFRIPISRLQGVRVKKAGENPARIEEYTAGWIGNVTWKSVIHFQAPMATRDLVHGDFVTARGFFLKDFAYPSDRKGIQVAPVFVLHSLARFEPPEDPLFERFGWAVAGSSLTVIGLIVFLLRRDKKKALALQSDLVRRRRARRARKAAEPLGSSGQEGTSSS